MSITKESVTKKLRPIFERAVRNKTGASYILTAAEAAVFKAVDLEALKVETGYPAPAFHILARWPN